ncbi:MAG: DUF58 domain-containing protein [Spirochaetota bacterium]
MLPEEIIKKIKLIDIKTRLLVDEMFSGEYHSVFKGRGIEFSEVREYTYGDDIRTIDWNVTARFGKPFVKVFEKERELTVILMFDLSSSTLFGSMQNTKREVMTELAALFIFSAIENNDRAAAVLFSDRVEKYIPPQKEKKHGLRLLRELLYFTPQGRGTSIKNACDFINNTHTSRSIIFLFSDFFDTGYQKSFKVMAKKHDVVPVIFKDPLEENIAQMKGVYFLKDLETGSSHPVDLSDSATRNAYIHNITEHTAGTTRLFSSLGVDYIEISTDRSYIKPLFNFFHKRASKR